MSLPDYVKLEYPITRPFPWKWVGLIAYVAVFVLAVFVWIVNVVLVGYETVSIFTNEFEKRDYHWYHKYMPTYKPTQNCDPVVFGLGDRFLTNSSLFEWQIESIDMNNQTVLEYRGEALDGCAMETLLIHAPLNWRRVEVIPVARCELAEGVMYLMTSMTADINDDSYASYKRNVGLSRSRSRRTPQIFALQGASYWAAFDTIVRYYFRPDFSELAFPIELSTRYDFPFCPANTTNNACFGTVTKPTTSDIFVTLHNGSYGGPGSSPAVDSLITSLQPSLLDMAQLFFAAVKLDFGNARENNVFLNLSVLNDTFVSNSNNLIQFLSDPPTKYPAASGYLDKLPLPSNFGASRIQTAYLCRYQRLKTPGSLFASVFAATSTVVTGFWGVSILIMTWWVKRDKPELNSCDHMGSYTRVVQIRPEMIGGL